MGSRNAIFAFCLAATLSAVACGTDDDSGSPGTAGTAGQSGKGNAGNAGSSGKAGGTNGGGDAGTATGGTAGADGGAGGEAGIGPVGCTQFADFVHTVIKEDTNATSVPRTVNGVVFCDDPADPAAYNDLF